MAKYDAVIIGGGLGGLTSGCFLSKEGMNVCVIEKHHQLGGCLQTFKRDNCIFDTGMHYIGSIEEGQTLNRFFKYFNILDRLKLKKLDLGCFDRINFYNDPKNYDYAVGYGRFRETFLENFPREKDAIDKYISKIKEVTSSLNIYNFREIDNSMNLISNEYLTQSASGFIDSCTDNPMLRNVLGGTNSLYAGKRDVSPLYMHAIINNSFIESACRFVDGGDQLAVLLADEIRKNGGTVLIRKEAVELISGEKGITSVKTSDGDIIEGDWFISDIHPVKTLEMTGSPLLRKAYRSRIESIPDTTSTFCIYVTFKENSFKYMNHNYYCFSSGDIWGVADYTGDEWPKGYMFLTPASSKSETWADCGIIMTYMNFNDVEKWSDTTIERRGEEYLNFKKEKAELLLDRVEERFPGFRSSIQSYYTSSPLTYRDYTGTHRGAIYGIERDCSDPLNSYISFRTKIPNLLLTGQNINMHGVVGVTISSLLTCGAILGLNSLIKKVRDV